MAGNLTAMIAAAFSGGAAPPVTTDPYFEYTTLLLPGNGTNGAQNNTFLDGSTNNFTITRNGNTTQGTFSPFSQTGWGNYFDGTGDYLSVADTAAIQLSTGDFTIEFWVNVPNTSQQTFITKWTAGSAGYYLGLSASNTIGFYTTAVSGGITASFTTTNQWVHVAAVRSGNTYSLYVNGSSVGTPVTTASSNADGGSALNIGRNSGNGINYTTGYISNVRIVKGTAVYTSNFTPPTAPLTAISGTSLLTCQSNRFIDNSSNNFTITVNGNTSVVAFSPFNPSASWSAATYGGSGYFDGSGDYLTASSTIIPTTGDVTIETWLYPTVAQISTVAYMAGAGPSSDFLFYYNSSGAIGIETGSAYRETATGLILLNTWQHLALTKSGSTYKIFLNGTEVTSTGAALAGTLTQSTLNIGGLGALNSFAGYFSNFRITQSIVYTANFTVPTAPLTAITNTSLLLNYTNAGIYDATSKNDLETVGNAQISTAIPAKWGSGSMAFDGTGDFLSVVSTSLLGYGTGNFTIEFWTYVTSTSNTPYFFDCRTTATANEAVPALYINGGNYEYYVSGAARITVGAVPTNQWVHVALVRNSGTTTLYSNGTSTGTYSDSTSYISCPMVIGQRKDTTSQSLNGYIQDFRVTKGYARYTANFTPPTAAFPTL